MDGNDQTGPSGGATGDFSDFVSAVDPSTVTAPSIDAGGTAHQITAAIAGAGSLVGQSAVQGATDQLTSELSDLTDTLGPYLPYIAIGVVVLLVLHD
jgi:hypothetical protein